MTDSTDPELDPETPPTPEELPTLAAEGSGLSDKPAGKIAAKPAAASISEKEGTMIGPYTLIDKLGEGGFGVVWRAKQSKPVKREIALKVIKAGRDTAEVVTRFEQERQALAVMDHPNIAKVYDAGATDSGRPYFVMELVEGKPITNYCDENRLTIKERLELFIPVCRAVQHAHAKGIVHRDLKPSNVMIAEHDGAPVPKVIDFGIAKAIEELPGENAVQTLEGMAIGTPVYMSPEQFSGSLDVDTRADVYSLGVMLYELLAGIPPVSQEELKMAGYAEMERLICEVDPPRPSLRVHETGEETAQFRRSDTTRLTRSIQGDLDWIVMRALEKDRARRYETATGLAVDIERHLADETVSAAAPSAGYQLKKFVRRNRGVLTAAAIIAVLLVVGSVVSTWQAIRATNAEEDAVAAKGEAEHNERVIAYRLAEETAPSDNPRIGLARLAKMLRDDPSNRLIGERLMMAAQQRDFIQPVTSLWGGQVVRFSQDGSVMLAANTGGHSMVYFTDTKTQLQAGKFLTLATPPTWAEFSPDSSLVVTASGPATGQRAKVQVWDWLTGRRISTPMAFEQRIHFARFSPDGSRIASGAAGWNVKIANIDSANLDEEGKLIEKPQLIGRYGPVIAGDWSHDGRFLAIVVNSAIRSTAEIWDTESNPPELVVEVSHAPAVEAREVFDGRITTVQFSADGSRFLTGGDDGTARLWDTATGQPIGETMHHFDRIDHAEFNRDGSLLVTGSDDGSVRVWMGETGAPVTRPLPMAGPVTCAHFDPHGMRVIAGDQKGGVAVWDAWTGERRGAPFRSEGAIYEATFFPDPKIPWIMVSSASKGQLWRFSPRQPEALTLRHEIAATNLNPIYSKFRAAMSPDGNYLVTPGYGGDFRLWDARSGTVMRTLDGSGTRQQAKFSRDGRTLLTFCESIGISVYRFGSGGTIEDQLVVDLKPGITSAELSPATESIVFAGGGGVSLNQAWIWRVGDDGEIRETALFPPDSGQDASTHTVRFDRTGERLATVSWDRKVRIWEVSTGKLLLTLKLEALDFDGQLAFVQSIDFSPTRNHLLVGYAGNRSVVWDLSPELAMVDRIVCSGPHRNEVNSVRYAPDGRRFVTSSIDRTAQVRDAATGERIGQGMDHGAAVRAANFSPDGRRVITGSEDGTARIWDAATGFPLSDPLVHDGNVYDATFSSDGNRVVTTAADGTVRIWDVPPAPESEVPEWVPRWIESILALRIEEDGQVTDLGLYLASWTRMRKEVEALPDDDYYARIAKWFYADFESRSITPFSPLKFEQYVESSLQMEPVESHEEALRVSPNDPEVLIDMAQHLRKSETDDASVSAHRADALERLAAELAVATDENDPENQLRTRIVLLQEQGQVEEEIEARKELIELVEGDEGEDNMQALKLRKELILRLQKLDRVRESVDERLKMAEHFNPVSFEDFGNAAGKYQAIAREYRDLGETDLALELHEKALQLVDEVIALVRKHENPHKALFAIRTKGRWSTEFENWEAAEAFFNEILAAVEIMDEKHEPKPVIALLGLLLGGVYLESNAPEAKWTKLGETLLKSVPDPDSIPSSTYRQRTARIFASHSPGIFLDEAMELMKETNDGDATRLALGMLHYRKGNFEDSGNLVGSVRDRLGSAGFLRAVDQHRLALAQAYSALVAARLKDTAKARENLADAEKLLGELVAPLLWFERAIIKQAVEESRALLAE